MLEVKQSREDWSKGVAPPLPRGLPGSTFVLLPKNRPPWFVEISVDYLSLLPPSPEDDIPMP
jgi:hypothetical protein